MNAVKKMIVAAAMLVSLTFSAAPVRAEECTYHFIDTTDHGAQAYYVEIDSIRRNPYNHTYRCTVKLVDRDGQLKFENWVYDYRTHQVRALTVDGDMLEDWTYITPGSIGEELFRYVDSRPF